MKSQALNGRETPRLAIGSWGLAAVLCLGTGCGKAAGPDYRAAIRRVRAEMVAAAAERDPAARLTRLAAVDTTGCPDNFTAYFRTFLVMSADPRGGMAIGSIQRALDKIALDHGAIEATDFNPEAPAVPLTSPLLRSAETPD